MLVKILKECHLLTLLIVQLSPNGPADKHVTIRDLLSNISHKLSNLAIRPVALVPKGPADEHVTIRDFLPNSIHELFQLHISLPQELYDGRGEGVGMGGDGVGHELAAVTLIH